jgi:hypothetical protein
MISPPAVADLQSPFSRSALITCDIGDLFVYTLEITEIRPDTHEIKFVTIEIKPEMNKTSLKSPKSSPKRLKRV